MSCLGTITLQPWFVVKSTVEIITLPIGPRFVRIKEFFGHKLHPQELSPSIVIFLFVPLSLFIFNLIRRDVRFPHCFLGYRMELQKAKEKFVWPLERIVDGHTRFSYVPHSFESDDIYGDFEKIGMKHIWVTPKVPFMIPLAVGFIISFILGDILFSLMQIFI